MSYFWPLFLGALGGVSVGFWILIWYKVSADQQARRRFMQNVSVLSFYLLIITVILSFVFSMIVLILFIKVNLDLTMANVIPPTFFIALIVGGTFALAMWFVVFVFSGDKDNG